MKKKSLWKDILRDIKGSLGRFIAIVAIIALGVAFFTGLKIAPEDMKLTADKYYNDYNFMDLRVLSTLGLTEDDVNAINNQKGIETARGAYSIDAIAVAEEREIALRIHDFVDEDAINAPRLLEGRFPEKQDECVIETGNQNMLDLKIGSKLKLSSGKKDDLNDDLKNTEFKVVGFIQSPDYLSFEKGSTDVGNGQLRDFIMIPQENFKMDVFTDIYATVKDTKELNSYEDEYFDRIKPVEDRIESLSSEREMLRYDEIYDEAREELDEGREEYEEEKEKAEKELDKALIELEDGRKEIEDGEKELSESENEFHIAIRDGENELFDAEKKLNDGEREYQKGLTQYNREKKKAEKEFTKAEDELKKAEDGIASLKSGIVQLESALENPELPKDKKKELEIQLKDLKSLLANTKKEYRSGKDELDKNKLEFNRAKDQAQKDFEIAEVELQNAEKDLKKAEEGIASLEENISKLKLAINNPQTPDDQKKELEIQLKELKSTLSNTEEQYKLGKEEFDKNKSEFNTEKEQAQREFAIAETEFQNAEKELKKAEEGIASLKDNISKLESAINNPQIPDDQKMELKTQLKELKSTLSKTESQYNSGKEELKQGREELLVAKKQLDDSKKEIDTARETLETEKSNLAREKEKGEIELEDAKVELSEAREDLQEGEKEYKEEKQKAEEELNKALIDIEKGERDLEELDDAEWYVLNREKHYSYVDYGGAADRIDALAKVFPIFFALVAALVTLTTMTRMVDEQRINIGTLKALGYRKKDIVAKYIIYSLTATILGVLFGVAIGYTIFPIIIFNAYGLMYAMPPVILSFNFQLAITVALVAITLTTLTSFLASNSELKENPSSLMRPKAPKLGKTVLIEKIPFIWNRFNFNYKVTTRNLFRYKRRFFMTVFGIAGSTALILAAFGIKDSIQTVVDRQFGELLSYDMEIGIEDDGFDALDKETSIEDYKLVLSEGGSLTFEGEEKDINITVPKDLEDFDKFIHLQNRKTGKKLDLKDGVIITEGMSRELDMKKGDTIELKNSDDVKVKIEIANIAENYTFNYIYMTSEKYEELFDGVIEYNEALTRLKDGLTEEEEEISEKLLSNGGIKSVNFLSTTKNDLDNTIQSLNYVVLLMTISAGALAFVVLYNLTNINISERIREIATIKVLGFYDNEVSAYIYRENIVLTIVGILTGLFIGIFLHRFIIETVEMESLMLGLSLHTRSYLYASVLTVVFAVIVNIVMHYKLKNIKMVESLKSID